MWMHTHVHVVCGHGHICPNNQAATSPCFWNHSDLSHLWDQWVGRPPKGKPEGTPGAQERPQHWLDRESQASAPAQGQRRQGGVKGGHHFFSQRRFTYWEGTWLKRGHAGTRQHTGWESPLKAWWPFKSVLQKGNINKTDSIFLHHTFKNFKLLQLSVQRNPNFLEQNSHPQWPPDGSRPALSSSFKPPQPESSNPLGTLPPHPAAQFPSGCPKTFRMSCAWLTACDEISASSPGTPGLTHIVMLLRWEYWKPIYYKYESHHEKIARDVVLADWSPWVF